MNMKNDIIKTYKVTQANPFSQIEVLEDELYDSTKKSGTTDVINRSKSV
jgi:hypothetical protein